MAPAALTLWLFTTIVTGFVVFLCARQDVLSKFFFFNCYFAASILASIGRFCVLSRDGYTSSNYLYFYYYSDAILSVLLALAVWQIGARLIAGKVGRQAVLITGASILLPLIFFTFAVVACSSSYLITRFTVELSENIFFAAALTTFFLWTWSLFNNADDRTATQFVNVLLVYFAVFYLVYWLGQARPYSRAHNGDLFSMMGAWLPLGCSFALVQDPPNAK